jgi:hypothetical protein
VIDPCDPKARLNRQFFTKVNALPRRKHRTIAPLILTPFLIS